MPWYNIAQEIAPLVQRGDIEPCIERFSVAPDLIRIPGDDRYAAAGEMLYELHCRQAREAGGTPHRQIAVAEKRRGKCEAHARHSQQFLVIQMHEKCVGLVAVHDDDQTLPRLAQRL